MRQLFATTLLVGTLLTGMPQNAIAQGFSFERMIPFLDRDRNGLIDPDEFDRVPGSMREWLLDHGYSPDEPIPVDELMDIAPQMSEDLRRAREADDDRSGSSESRRPSFGGWGGRDEGRSRFGSRGDRSEPSEPASKSPERVTVSLPAKYRDADLDGDGQIGLYEWKLWKPGQLDEFFRLDLNGDGFLTPRELVLVEAGKGRPAAESAGSVRTATVSTGGGTSRIGTASATTFSRSSPSSGSPSSSASSGSSRSGTESREARMAGFYFKELDQNGDGSITQEEWSRSTRLRPLFEQAGYDLSQPLSEEKFMEGYLKATAPKPQ